MTAPQIQPADLDQLRQVAADHAGQQTARRDRMLAEALEAEPHAEPERRRAIKFAFQTNPENRAVPRFTDIVFGAAKSVSIYHAGLIEAGRTGDGEQVLAAFRDATIGGVHYLQKEAGLAKVDRRYLTAPLRAHVLGHVTAENGDPHVHIHVIVDSYAEVDGAEWPVGFDGIRRCLPGLEVVYQRSYEQAIEAVRPVLFEWRSDSSVREIIGMGAAGWAQLRGTVCRVGFDQLIMPTLQ